MLQKALSHAACEQPEDEGCQRLSRSYASLEADTEPEVVLRDAHPPDFRLLGELKSGRKDNRVDVHVEVAVNMRQLEPCGKKSLELGRELFSQLFASGSGKIILQTGGNGIVGEVAFPIDEIGDF